MKLILNPDGPSVVESDDPEDIMRILQMLFAYDGPRTVAVPAVAPPPAAVQEAEAPPAPQQQRMEVSARNAVLMYLRGRPSKQLQMVDDLERQGYTRVAVYGAVRHLRVDGVIRPDDADVYSICEHAAIPLQQARLRGDARKSMIADAAARHAAVLAHVAAHAPVTSSDITAAKELGAYRQNALHLSIRHLRLHGKIVLGEHGYHVKAGPVAVPRPEEMAG